MRRLGIVLDSGRISWALTEDSGPDRGIVASNVLRFRNGMNRDGSGREVPPAAERTRLRAIRRNLRRRRLRKIQTLRVLMKYGYCPAVPEKELDAWRYGKKYPSSPELADWLRYDVGSRNDPYYDRMLCATRRLDFSMQENRYRFGRAVYHMAQRRGYRSNATDESHVNRSGEVLTGIREVSGGMAREGCATLGEYLYRMKGKGERVRGIHASREEHYMAELRTMCMMQGVGRECIAGLEDALFMVRGMKSQKRSVGRCVFEPARSRCQVSQPIFEEYRMLCFVNNIRVKDKGQEMFHPLTEPQRSAVFPLFFRRRDSFTFGEIMDRLAGKGGGKGTSPMAFNYRRDDAVSGCPVTAAIITLLGAGCDHRNWKDVLMGRYRGAVSPSGHRKDWYEASADVWRILMDGDRETRVAWLMKNICGCDVEDARSAAATAVSKDYSAVSVKFIRGVLPWLAEGCRFDEAVFLGSMKDVLKGSPGKDIGLAEEAAARAMRDWAATDPKDRRKTKEECMKEAVAVVAGNAPRWDRLRRPDRTGRFSVPVSAGDGTMRLGSPRDGRLRNPLVMRTLHQLRHLVNSMLARGLITPDTPVIVNCTREMNPLNGREGIRMWQKERERRNAEYSEEIRRFFLEEYGREVVPTDEQVLKYRLWEEQKHVCLYTGKSISLADIYGPGARFDIRYSIPVSLGGDDTEMNKTLCDSGCMLRRLPAVPPWQLPEDEYAALRKRLDEAGFTQAAESLADRVSLLKGRGRRALDPDDKAFNLRMCAKAGMDCAYWKGKVFRLTAGYIPKNLGPQDTSGATIRAYAIDYLKSLFRDVRPVRECTLSSFRRLWGFTKEDGSGENVIDACIASSLGEGAVRKWERYWKLYEENTWAKARRPVLEPPWPSFREDVLARGETLCVRNTFTDRTLSGGKRRLRDSRGRIRRNVNGGVIFQKSDRFPVRMFDRTNYGVRRSDGRDVVVNRVGFSSLKESGVGRIFDPGLRNALEARIGESGFGEAVKGFTYCGGPVRRVLCVNRHVAGGLVPVKEHRDRAASGETRHVLQVNASNYALAVYGGDTSRIVRGYQAAEALRLGLPVIPPFDALTGKPLTGCIRAGQHMILYGELSDVDLGDRRFVASHLHVLSSVAMNGNKVQMRIYRAGDPARTIIRKQFDAVRYLTEGEDFYIDYLGDCHRIEKEPSASPALSASPA